MEEWRDVHGYEGRYQVSNIGRVRSVDRLVRIVGNNYRPVRGKILSIGKYPNGYSMVNFTDGKGKVSTKLVHRLVADAFIPNPNNFPQVNHKDENINNNNVDNLEWCTPKYNANYGTRNARCLEKNKRFFKAVYQIDKDCGMIIRYWENISEASRALGINDSQIGRVCRKEKRNNTAGGYVWRYATEYDKEVAI